MDSLADVLFYLERLRLLHFVEPDSFTPERDCRGFSFRTLHGLDLRAELAGRPDFRRGVLGFTHIRHVGFPVADYRSLPSAEAPLSLQINLGPRGCRLDLDRYNPYTGPTDFFLHVTREVLRLY